MDQLTIVSLFLVDIRCK